MLGQDPRRLTRSLVGWIQSTQMKTLPGGTTPEYATRRTAHSDCGVRGAAGPHLLPVAGKRGESPNAQSEAAGAGQWPAEDLELAYGSHDREVRKDAAPREERFHRWGPISEEGGAAVDRARDRGSRLSSSDARKCRSRNMQ